MVNRKEIRISDLCFGIGGFKMSNVSLVVEPGEYVVLTGPNGSGKTLLIRLILGLYRPLSGSIHIGGRDVLSVPPWDRRMGYVPQDGLLFPRRTVYGNLVFGLEVRGVSRRARRSEVERLAGVLGITSLLDRTPGGLSGGERQRVCLCRALLLKPEVLLLDEPVSAISEADRDAICLDLKRLQQERGTTALHVSHIQQETTLVADRVVTMRALSSSVT